MDNLARDAMLAKQAGMSYGQWKAMQPKQEKNPDEIPDGWLVCAYCGKPFKPKTKRPMKYCEAYCANKANYDREKNAERVRKCREKNDRQEEK